MDATRMDYRILGLLVIMCLTLAVNIDLAFSPDPDIRHKHRNLHCGGSGTKVNAASANGCGW